MGSHCTISSAIEIPADGTTAGSIETSKIGCRVTGGTSRRISAGIAVVSASLASHGSRIAIPPNIAGIIAEHFRYIVVWVSGWTGPGLMVHIAELHLGEDIRGDGLIADEAGSGIVGRCEGEGG